MSATVFLERGQPRPRMKRPGSPSSGQGGSRSRWGGWSTFSSMARARLRRSLGVALLVALAALVASCSSPRQQFSSPVPVPAAFSTNGTAVLPDEWWRSFQDPLLDRLVAAALAGNFTLRAVWDRLAQAEAVARKAGAPVWPWLDATAGASRTVQRQGTVGPNGGGQTSYFTGLSLGLIASYEVDLWGRIRSSKQAAAWDVRASEAQVRAAAITLSAQVASVWYGLVEQYGQLDLLRRQLGINEKVLQSVTLRFRRSRAGAADVLQQRQLVEARQGDIAVAESRAAVLRHQLAILLGRDPHAEVAPRVTEPITLPPLPDAGLPADLLQRRPDVQAAYYGVLAADRRVAAAVADQYPRITLSAQGSTSGSSPRDLFDNWMATLAANLVAPLFEGDQRRAEVARTRAVVSERLHVYGQTVLDALGEVEDALRQEQHQRELLASLDRQVQLSAQVIERVRDSYTKGAVDYLRVLDALVTQQNFERSQIQARRQLLDYRINLCRALGGGWAMARPKLARVETADREEQTK